MTTMERKIKSVSNQKIFLIENMKLPLTICENIKEFAFNDYKKHLFEIIQRGILYNYPLNICERCGEYINAEYYGSKSITLRQVKTSLRRVEIKVRGICEFYNYTGCKYNTFLNYINNTFRDEGIDIIVRIHAFMGTDNEYINEAYFSPERIDRRRVLDEYDLFEIENLFTLREKKIHCKCYNSSDDWFLEQIEHIIFHPDATIYNI